KLADEPDSAGTDLSKDQVGGNHEPVQKGQTNRAFKEGNHCRIGVNRGLARKPILKRRSGHAAFIRKLPLRYSSVGERFKSDDLSRGRGTTPSRLFRLVRARDRIRLRHGFGSGDGLLFHYHLAGANRVCRALTSSFLALQESPVTNFGSKNRKIMTKQELQTLDPWPKR